MPYIDLDDHELIVDLPPANIQGVTLNRKAHAHTVQIEDIDKRVVMHVQVYYYGEDGNPINSPDKGIMPYLRTLIANNSIFVNMADGSPLCPVFEEYDAEGNLNPLLADKNYTKEYQLFREMSRHPQVIDDLKRNKILYAASVGRLD